MRDRWAIMLNNNSIVVRVSMAIAGSSIRGMAASLIVFLITSILIGNELINNGTRFPMVVVVFLIVFFAEIFSRFRRHNVD